MINKYNLNADEKLKINEDLNPDDDYWGWEDFIHSKNEDILGHAIYYEFDLSAIKVEIGEEKIILD